MFWCIIGADGFFIKKINDFLSWKIWTSLSPYTYGAYLWSVIPLGRAAFSPVWFPSQN